MNINRKVALMFLTLSLGASPVFVESAEAGEMRYQRTTRSSSLVAGRDAHLSKYSPVNYGFKKVDRYSNNGHNFHQKKRVWIPGSYHRNLKTLKRVWVPAHWEFRY